MSRSRTSPARRPLIDVSLEVPAGSTLAVVGATGSGKTTLGYLLARLYDADSGSITIDGVDVRDLSLSVAVLDGGASSPRILTCCTRRSPRTFVSPDPMPPTTSWAGLPARPGSTT